MTHRLDVACSRALAARWCALAEKRLDHLTELFESGRWRRYYSEYSFLENIQEAKLAVKNWRALSLGESIAPRRTGFTLTVADGRPMLDPPSDDSTEQDDAIEQPILLAPTIGRVIADSGIVVPEEILVPEEIVAPDVAPLAPRIDMAALEAALSIGIRAEMSPPPIFDLDAIERRYPALRHAL
jgi:uncharacterized repeat protein (TIGR03809 family)